MVIYFIKVSEPYRSESKFNHIASNEILFRIFEENVNILLKLTRIFENIASKILILSKASNSLVFSKFDL